MPAEGPVHLLGNPKVFLDHRTDGTLVAVLNSPWGFSGLDKMFLGGIGGAARSYGLELVARFRKAALAAQARQRRLEEAKRKERRRRCLEAEGQRNV